MGARESLQRMIDRKQQEIKQFEDNVRSAQVYIQALQDAMKSLPRESQSGGTGDATLRPGTIVYKTREVLRERGIPLHISDLLKAIGRSVDKNNRVAVAGTLSAYVRRGEIFTRPAPNTYGLVEMENGNKKTQPIMEEELPESFGR
jgi:hypothetical protein